MGHNAPRSGQRRPLWPLLAVGAIIVLQLLCLQAALHRLAWARYAEVQPAVIGTIVLALASWGIYRLAAPEKRF